MQTIYTNFFKVPTEIYNMRLLPIECLVLNYLFSLSGNNIIHPSKKTIAEKTRLSRRTVDKAIKSLVNKGILEYNRGFIKGTKRICNQYRIRLEKFAPNCIKKSQQQIECEINNESECLEMIMESVREYNKEIFP